MKRALLTAHIADAAGAPTAALLVGEETIIARLIRQVAACDIEQIVVATRPGWVGELRNAIGDLPAEVVACEVNATFELVGSLASQEDTTHMVIALGDIVTHDGAISTLVLDPRISNGILSSRAARVRRQFRVSTLRGRVVQAESAFHLIGRGGAYNLGILSVGAVGIPILAQVCSQLSELTRNGWPEPWEEELAAKLTRWGTTFFKLKGPALQLAEHLERNTDPLWQRQAKLTRDSIAQEFEEFVVGRAERGRHDVVSLLTTGIVRAGADVHVAYLRELYWDHPTNQEAATEAVERLARIDEDLVHLNSAVKGADGFFTTFFVSPYSKYIARAASRRGITPNQVTVFSLLLGVVAAAAFAGGSKAGLILGAIVLQAAFTMDCVDGQLARYTHNFSKLGGWLDSIFDRTKEYLVFAGLAIGAVRTGSGRDVWLLAAAALGAQTVRHLLDFAYAAAKHQEIRETAYAPLSEPDPIPPEEEREEELDGDETELEPDLEEEFEMPPRTSQAGRLMLRMAEAISNWGISLSHSFESRGWMRWLKRIVTLPIGERFATISVTAAIWGPRTTFVVLLWWGGVAGVYSAAGRVLRSVVP